MDPRALLIGLLAACAAGPGFGQPGAPKRPAPATLLLSNPTKLSVWVTIYDTGSPQPRVLKTECLAPGGTATIPVGSALQPLRLRGEATIRPQCQAPVACDTSTQVQMKGAAQLKHEFRQQGPACSWAPK